MSTTRPATSNGEDFAALALALASAALGSPAAYARRWLLMLDGATAVSVSAEDGWMRWAATSDPPLCTTLLDRQAALPLTLKYSMPPGSPSPVLHCEWPIAEDVDVVRRVDELRRAFEMAQACVHGDPPAAMQAAEPEPTPTPDLLVALCAEGGWAASTHSEGVRVALRGARGAFDATIESSASRGVRLVVDLLRDAGIAHDHLSPAAVAATVRLLVDVSGCVRFVRPFMLRVPESALAIGFEANLGATPAASELGHALGALAAACALCGPEVVALCSTDLAARIESLIAPAPDCDITPGAIDESWRGHDNTPGVMYAT